MNYSTIHIFNFGIVQVIGKNFNIQTSISNVQSEVDACIDEIWSKVPTSIQKDYHSINIFNNVFSSWNTRIKGEEGFRVDYKDLDASLFEALVTSVKAI
jgi:hypothetical protein